MSRVERMRVFEDFQHKRIDVLFCTAFIEDVPSIRNVSSIVLEYADKFSLIRLHRLRGLLYESYYGATCYLIASQQSHEEKLEKLKFICQQNNGFLIAEHENEVELPLQWQSEMTSQQRLLVREYANSDTLKKIQKNRWPQLLSTIQGWWPELSLKIQGTRRKKYKKRRFRKRR